MRFILGKESQEFEWMDDASEEVAYCKEGCVDMFSDTSDFQLAGFEGEQVC